LQSMPEYIQARNRMYVKNVAKLFQFKIIWKFITGYIQVRCLIHATSASENFARYKVWGYIYEHIHERNSSIVASAISSSLSTELSRSMNLNTELRNCLSVINVERHFYNLDTWRCTNQLNVYEYSFMCGMMSDTGALTCLTAMHKNNVCWIWDCHSTLWWGPTSAMWHHVVW
jgi:hypothetical protein